MGTPTDEEWSDFEKLRAANVPKWNPPKCECQDLAIVVLGMSAYGRDLLKVAFDCISIVAVINYRECFNMIRPSESLQICIDSFLLSQ